MRNPLQALLIHASFFVVALGTVLLTLLNRESGVAQIGMIAGAVTVTSAIAAFRAALSLRGYYRLRAGRGVIARWNVSAAEWSRFRTIDRVRATEGSKLSNILGIRRRAPVNGIDVVIGQRDLLVDGMYKNVPSFAPDGRTVNWLPGDPDCLEFPICSTFGQSGKQDYATLRIPVPIAARAEGLRVLDHYMTTGP